MAVCAVAQQDPPVNAMEWAIVARDQQVIHFRCAEPPTTNPGKYADELLDAYLLADCKPGLKMGFSARARVCTTP